MLGLLISFDIILHLTPRVGRSRHGGDHRAGLRLGCLHQNTRQARTKHQVGTDHDESRVLQCRIVRKEPLSSIDCAMPRFLSLISVCFLLLICIDPSAQVVPNSVQRRVIHNKVTRIRKLEALRHFEAGHKQKPQRTVSKNCDASGKCQKEGLKGRLEHGQGLHLCQDCPHVGDHGMHGTLLGIRIHATHAERDFFSFAVQCAPGKPTITAIQGSKWKLVCI